MGLGSDTYLVTVRVVPGAAHVAPGGGVQVLTVIVAVDGLTRVSVEVAATTPPIRVFTDAEFPFTVPVYVTPVDAGSIRVMLRLEPVCATEYLKVVPFETPLQLPAKFAGATSTVPDEPPPPALVSVIVDPAGAHVNPGGGVQVLTVIVAVESLTRVTVDVPASSPFIKLFTDAEFPFIVPVSVRPANTGSVRVKLTLEPVCTTEYLKVVPFETPLQLPAKFAGVTSAVSGEPPPPQAATIRPQPIANNTFHFFI